MGGRKIRGLLSIMLQYYLFGIMVRKKLNDGNWKSAENKEDSHQVL